MSAAPSAEVSGLTRRFGGLVAVNDVTFEVAAGEIAGLIGPNGAGKTTLFNMLAGSMAAAPAAASRSTARTAPASRRTRWRGAASRARSRSPACFRVSRPSTTSSRRPTAPGAPAGASALLRTPAYRHEEEKAAERAREILAFVDLDRHADVLADELSYGEQRRLEIAIALAAEPTLLLLDEPAAGMNPEEGQRLVAMIRQIRDRGVTVLLVEHHMRVVMSVCHRVIVIDHGVKIAEGAPQPSHATPR